MPRFFFIDEIVASSVVPVSAATGVPKRDNFLILDFDNLCKRILQLFYSCAATHSQ